MQKSLRRKERPAAVLYPQGAPAAQAAIAEPMLPAAPEEWDNWSPPPTGISDTGAAADRIRRYVEAEGIPEWHVEDELLEEEA